jgi:hypothetical protein
MPRKCCRFGSGGIRHGIRLTALWLRESDAPIIGNHLSLKWTAEFSTYRAPLHQKQRLHVVMMPISAVHCARHGT